MNDLINCWLKEAENSDRIAEDNEKMATISRATAHALRKCAKEAHEQMDKMPTVSFKYSKENK